MQDAAQAAWGSLQRTLAAEKEAENAAAHVSSLQRSAAAARLAMRQAVEQSERMVDYNTEAIRTVSKSEDYITSAGDRVRNYLHNIFQAKQHAMDASAKLGMEAQQAQELADQAANDQQRAKQYAEEAKEAAASANMARANLGETETQDEKVVRANLTRQISNIDPDRMMGSAGVVIPAVTTASIVSPMSTVIGGAGSFMGGVPTTFVGGSGAVGGTPLTDAKELVDTVCTGSRIDMLERCV